MNRSSSQDSFVPVKTLFTLKSFNFSLLELLLVAEASIEAVSFFLEKEPSLEESYMMIYLEETCPVVYQTTDHSEIKFPTDNRALGEFLSRVFSEKKLEVSSDTSISSDIEDAKACARDLINENVTLGEAKAIFGKAVGVVIASNLLENLEELKTKSYSSFHQKNADFARNFRILYSNSPYSRRDYPVRKLGANYFFRKHQEEYARFGVDDIDFDDQKNASKIFNTLLEKLYISKLSEAIKQSIKGNLEHKEEKLLFQNVGEMSNEDFVSIFSKMEDISFELTAEGFNENTSAFFEKMLNRVLKLYRENNLSEHELAKMLKFFIIDRNSYDDNGLNDLINDIIKKLHTDCSDHYLKYVLEKLENNIEDMKIKNLYSYIYGEVNEIPDELAKKCENFSRFRELFLAVGETPSNQLIEMACTLFQEQRLQPPAVAAHPEIFLSVSTRGRERGKRPVMGAAAEQPPGTPTELAPNPTQNKKREKSRSPCCTIL